jgi:hypothetical protein
VLETLSVVSRDTRLAADDLRTMIRFGQPMPRFFFASHMMSG